MNVPPLIWQDVLTKEIYQGRVPLAPLPPLTRMILLFLLKHPEVYVTKSELVENSWPAGHYHEGVSDEAIYQQMTRLRKRLRVLAPKHRYIVNWRGVPEGGYRFFPDGQPYKKATSSSTPTGVQN